MDAKQFDRLARFLAAPQARRSLLGLLATLPLLGGLLAILDPDHAEAKGRRKRRKKRHKHGKGRDKGKHKKKKCQPNSTAKTCAGKCGLVKNNCKKMVDCGSCDCPEPCGACFICQSGSTTPGACVLDPEQQGQSCGSDGQFCQSDGACACNANSCENSTPICAAGECIGCGNDSDCEAAGVGDLCCNGSCFTGVCCGNQDCPTEQAPDCVGHACVCAANNNVACAGAQTCCDDGCFDLLTNANNCGACGHPCPPGHVCQEGACRFACGSGTCASASEICVNNTCQTCDVVCDASAVVCGAALQEALDGGGTIYVCPGTYRGGIVASTAVTVIGAGQGNDPRLDTILDGNEAVRVMRTAPFVGPVVLERLRLTHGFVSGDQGAGIRHDGQMLRMRDCTVASNVNNAPAGGGISVIAGSVAELTRCTLIQNKALEVDPAPGSGGGLVTAGNTTLTDCLVTENHADGGGGGIATVGAGRLTLAGVTEVRDNTASFGGGLMFNGNVATIGADCRITGNTAAEGRGGGIFRSAGTVTLEGADPSPIVVLNCHENCVGTVPKCAAGGACPPA